MDPAPASKALEVGSWAVKPPVPLLVAESAEPPLWAVLVLVVLVVLLASTTVMPGHPHSRFLLLSWYDALNYLVEGGPLYWYVGTA
jgi:hypothetical protein